MFLKLLKPKQMIELNIVKLNSDSQVLFLFKEISIYDKLSKAQVTEKFTNMLINSVAHNLFTPLNALIELNKSMNELLQGQDGLLEKNTHMIGVCLQQLVFTTHNFLEMAKIRQQKFQPEMKAVYLSDRLNSFMDFFQDDMNYRQIEFTYNIDETLKTHLVLMDETRFSIVFYNLFSNSVKHTNQGKILIDAKIIN